MDRDERARLDVGDYSYCGWVRRPETARDSAYLRLSVSLKRHTGFTLASPIAMAASSLRTERRVASGPEPMPVPGLGDEVFLLDDTDRVYLVARRANVTLTIDINLDPQRPGGHADSHAEAVRAARSLSAAILSGITVGQTRTQ
ncbi:hypothetical protein ACQP2X_39440 [Actinoplanes sp. CA-131856]